MFSLRNILEDSAGFMEIIIRRPDSAASSLAPTASASPPPMPGELPSTGSTLTPHPVPRRTTRGSIGHQVAKPVMHANPEDSITTGASQEDSRMAPRSMQDATPPIQTDHVTPTEATVMEMVRHRSMIDAILAEAQGHSKPPSVVMPEPFDELPESLPTSTTSPDFTTPLLSTPISAQKPTSMPFSGGQTNANLPEPNDENSWTTVLPIASPTRPAKVRAELSSASEWMRGESHTTTGREQPREPTPPNPFERTSSPSFQEILASKHQQSPNLGDDEWLVQREKVVTEQQEPTSGQPILDPAMEQEMSELKRKLLGGNDGAQDLSSTNHLPHDFQWSDIPPTPLRMAEGSVETIPPRLTQPEEAFLKTMRHYEEIGQLLTREGSRLGLTNGEEIGQALEQEGRRVGHQMLQSRGHDAHRLAL